MHIDIHWRGEGAFISVFHVVYASPGIYSRSYSLAKSVAEAAATTCTADAAALKRYIRSIDRTYAV